MKILFLNDDFPPFGWSSPGILTLNLAKKLKEQGYDVYILTTSQNKNFNEYEEIDGLKYYKVYSSYHVRWRNYLCLYNYQIVNKIDNIFKTIQPDVTHLHNIHQYLSYRSITIAKKYSKKVFLTAHDYLLFSHTKIGIEFLERRYTNIDFLRHAGKRYNPFRNVLIRHFINKLDKIFALSEAQKKILETNRIKKVDVLYNAIEVDKWNLDDKEVEKFKDKFNLHNKKIILFSGRPSNEKGLMQILKSFSIIKQQIPECILLIIWKKDNFFNEAILELDDNLKNGIIMTGWLKREKMKIAFYSTNVVVTPSVYPDPFNMINLEAMVSKKPVVGTCYGGTPEIVKDNETGFIVDPYNVKLMAENIINLLEDNDKALELGKKGYQRAKNHFSLDKHINKLMSYYEDIN